MSEPEEAVVELYRLMALEQLQALRAALVLDAEAARRRVDADGAVFCWGRITLIDDELTRRRETA